MTKHTMTRKSLLILILALGPQSFALDIFNPEKILDQAKNTLRADDIPAGAVGYAYIPGAAAGADSIPASTYANVFKIGAGFNASLSRQCGALNPFKNMSAQLKGQVQEKVDKFRGFISSLPSQIAGEAVEYTLAKVNPDLYQLTQKNLDEYFELFQINVKSCEDVRGELTANPNADPFNTIAQIAIADEWKRSIGSGGFSNDYHVKERIAKRALEQGVSMADGKKYGGKNQAPIDFTKSIAIAGLNTITGRSDKSAWQQGFSAAAKAKSPILRYFETPKALVTFLTTLYGSEEIRLVGDNRSRHTRTQAGVGIGREYNRLRNRNLVALRKYAARTITRDEFERQTRILLPPAEMEDIRQAEPYAQATLLEDKAKQAAIDELVIKLKLARDAINAGVKAPDMVQSGVAALAEKRADRLNYRILDDIATLDNSRY